jgi:pimeloyl-ACP methyl ester carboxylesterase
MTSSVTATDGVVLAVHRYTDIDPARPTILAIHGYPDNHHVWDATAEHLAEHYPGRYNFAAYDVRGAGGSSAPENTSGYRFGQLRADLAAVIEHLGVDRVHLLGHDWGSIQGWAAVTDATLMPKIGSFTSISGPHLDYGGKFLRSPRSLRGIADVVKQVLASGYMFFFLTPRAPELAFRSGVGGKVVEALARIGESSTRAQRRVIFRSSGDYLNGLNLYRANLPAPLLFPADPLPATSVAVQVLAPRRDVFVRPAVQRFAGAIPANGRVVEIEGGHWVPAGRPDVIARLTTEWADRFIVGKPPV